MSPAAIFLLAISMSADAFAASISKGAELRKPRFRDAIFVGLIFGVIEAITPVLGWVAGVASQRFVESWDHWIAFFMLLMIGCHMIYNGVRGEERVKNKKQSLGLLVLTAIATSIDAMAVGVSLAFIDANILIAALSIGLATTVMVTIGTLIGRHLGKYIGHWAEVAGGVILVVIGFAILLEHTGVM